MQQLLGRMAQFFELGQIIHIERAGGYSSKNYFVETETGAYLFKVTEKGTGVGDDGRPASAFLNRMAAHGFRFAPFLRSQKGEDMYTEGNLITTVQERVDASPPEEVTEDVVRQVGADLARMHLIPCEGLPARPCWLHQDHLKESIALLKESYRDFEGIEELVTTYETMGVDWNAQPQSMIHGDLSSGNVLFKDGELVTFIDWEDLSVGAAVLDFGMTALNWCFDENSFDRGLYAALRTGYESIRPLTPAEQSLVAPAVRFCGVTFAVWRFLDAYHHATEMSGKERYLAYWKQGLGSWKAP